MRLKTKCSCHEPRTSRAIYRKSCDSGTRGFVQKVPSTLNSGAYCEENPLLSSTLKRFPDGIDYVFHVSVR